MKREHNLSTQAPPPMEWIYKNVTFSEKWIRISIQILEIAI